MKIAVIADPHLEALKVDSDLGKLKVIAQSMRQVEVDCCLILGDIDSGLMPSRTLRNYLLAIHPKTYWILGNHDLWDPYIDTPPEAMRRTVKRYGHQNGCLETCWNSRKIIGNKKVMFVGTMGFPDFQHPYIQSRAEWYNLRSATKDPRYIDLGGGWMQYTTPMMKSFLRRFHQALRTKPQILVVPTHYAIHPLQVEIEKGQNTWPYFFNWTIGQEIQKAAENTQTKILCLCGHSHQYCRGTLEKISTNLWVCGLDARYFQLNVQVFEWTKDGFTKMPLSFAEGLSDFQNGRLVDMDTALNEPYDPNE